MLRLQDTPRPLFHLITAILLTSPSLTTAKPYPKDTSQRQAGIGFNQLFGRNTCAGQLCGWNNQLCCEQGYACYTDSHQQAQCSSTAHGGEATAEGGYYEMYTTTYVETNLQTVTKTGSSFVGGGGGAVETGSGDAKCHYALNETPCGGICCASDQYCYQLGQCRAAAGGGGSSGHKTTYVVPATSGVVGDSPFRPTSSSLVLVTEIASPTTTIPFETPVATGANVTLTSSEQDNDGDGGLSGGAIAGIVIGTLAGLLLLGLICFYCCIKGLLDGCLAIFGLGGRKKRREREVDVYERHHHRGSRYGSSAPPPPAGRTWYGASRPSRPARKDDHGGKGLLGVGAGLAGLAAVLGLKRRHDRKNEKYESDYGSYSSDYYTSASSASSDDRRTRDTRRSASRSRRY